MLELEKLKNVRAKHANDKKQEIEKLKSELEKVKNQKKDRAKQLEKETTGNLEVLKKDHITKVFFFCIIEKNLLFFKKRNRS